LGLVVRAATGEVQTVKYLELIPMLLNELQRLQREVAVLQNAVGSRPTTIAVPVFAKGETDEAMR
jgi:hypothetical protein